MTELMKASALISHSPNSPSFNTYSSEALAEIAVRVVQEFADDNIFSSWKDHDISNDAVFNNTQNDDEFEFAFICKEPTSPVSADEIFFNGKIKPLYEPIIENSPPPSPPLKPARLPLGKLFKKEKESKSTESCSTSESGELEGVPTESYCVWAPGTEAVSPGQCKKSSSTGTSSKRWKFRDLLYRSHSEGGKETFVFLAAKRNGEEHGKNGEKGNKESNVIGGNGNTKGNDREMGRDDRKKEGNDSVVGESEVKSGKKLGEKRRTFLPYRQELVGIFSNGNGVGRKLHPF